MSTKTTFKRIALVTVAALGFGVVSSVPSNAAAQLDSIAVSLASTTQVTTETLTATASVVTATFAGTKGVDTLTVTASIVSGPAFVAPILTLKETTTSLATGSGTGAIAVSPLDTNTVTQATAKFTVHLNAPTVAGTYVVRLTPTGGTYAVAKDVTIVVSEKVIQGPSATNSKLYLQVTNNDYNANVAYDGGGNTYAAVYNSGPSASYLADTYTVAVASSPLGTIVGNLGWKLFGANTAVAAKRTPVTISVSGPGYISFQADPTKPFNGKAKSITESKLVTVANDPYDPGSQDGSFWLYSEGIGGVSTITATMDGVVLGTRKVSFIGTPTAFVFGTPSKSSIGVGETASVTVTGTDSLLTSTGAASVWASSSDATIAAVNSNQSSTLTITGVKSGKATITVRNNADATLATITKTLSVTVGALTAKTVTFSFDNNSPQPGEKVTLTVEALDASGNPVGDGTRNLFSSAGITTSLQVQGATWAAQAGVALVGGKATYTFYAPTGTGTLEVSATQGTALDNVVALASSATAIKGSISVVNAGVDAALDAANEAATAAQDATDAAIQAADAADAATEAVAALQLEVNTLIAGLKKQLTTLTNLVKNLAKAVAKK